LHKQFVKMVADSKS